MKSWLFLLSDQQKFSPVDTDGKLYRKELIYAGTFEKDGEFTVGKPDFQRWLSNFSAFTNNGNQVFLQLEHSESPEDTRGEMVNLELAKNDKGKDALFGYIRFRDEDSQQMAKTAQVSVYVVSDYTDGKGKNYEGGLIKHVALTQSPVIPSLQKFEIAASLVASKKKGKSPMIKMLAKHMGIEGIGDDTPDEIAFSQILARFSAMDTELAEYKKGKKPGEKDEEVDDKVDDEVDDEEDDEKKKKKPPMLAASIVSRFAKQEIGHRKRSIDTLLSAGKITKPVAEDLKKQFAEEKSLVLSFDHKGDKGFVDGFEATMGALEKNDKVLSFNERSGPQDGNREGGKSKTSPLVADAERRAAARK